jgi:hypothetical protein
MNNEWTEESLSAINRLGIVHCMLRSYDSGTLQLWAERTGATMSPLLEFSGISFMSSAVEFFSPRFRIASNDEREGVGRLAFIDAYTTLFAIDAVATESMIDATYLIAAAHMMPMHTGMRSPLDSNRTDSHDIERA